MTWYIVNFSLVLFILLSRFFLNYSYYCKTTPYCGVPFVLFSIKKYIIIISLVSRKHCKVVSRNARAKMVSCACVTCGKHGINNDSNQAFGRISSCPSRSKIVVRLPLKRAGILHFFSFFSLPLPPAHFPLPSRDRYRTKTPLPRHLVLSTGIFSAQW